MEGCSLIVAWAGALSVAQAQVFRETMQGYSLFVAANRDAVEMLRQQAGPKAVADVLPIRPSRSRKGP